MNIFTSPPSAPYEGGETVRDATAVAFVTAPGRATQASRAARKVGVGAWDDVGEDQLPPQAFDGRFADGDRRLHLHRHVSPDLTIVT